MIIDNDYLRKNKIAKLCKKIEKTEKIKIIFAIESGSLVYGFPSKDSDRDIRFVYYYPFVYPYEKYISYTSFPMTYERMFNEKLETYNENDEGILFDAVGWHIYKYAQLLANSNPMTIEWMHSPIIYYGEIPAELRNFAIKYYKPIALYHHYFNICKKNFERMQKKDDISYKGYLYPLMGAFKATYVLRHKKIPPVSIQETLEKLSNDIPKEIIEKCFEIIKIKQEMSEKDISGRIKIFDDFIEEFVLSQEHEQPIFEITQTERRHEKLNDIIRSIILEGSGN